MAVSLQGCPTSLTSSARPHYLPTKLELTTVPICVQSSPVLKRLCAALESVRTEQVMLNTPGVLATAVAETAMIAGRSTAAPAHAAPATSPPAATPTTAAAAHRYGSARRNGPFCAAAASSPTPPSCAGARARAPSTRARACSRASAGAALRSCAICRAAPSSGAAFAAGAITRASVGSGDNRRGGGQSIGCAEDHGRYYQRHDSVRQA